MARITVPAEITLARRERVAQLRLRGLTIREIQAEVGKVFVNPNTNRPFTHQAIHDDLKALSAQWQQDAAATVSEHRARLLAELGQVKRLAWAEKDLQAVLRAIKTEADLIGANAPQRIAQEVKQEVVFRVVYDDEPDTNRAGHQVTATTPEAAAIH